MPIYIKLDALELLLLSEGVCRHLGIISYHSNVQISGLVQQDQAETDNSCTVPTIRVHIVQDLWLLSDECVTTQKEKWGR